MTNAQRLDLQINRIEEAAREIRNIVEKAEDNVALLHRTKAQIEKIERMTDEKHKLMEICREKGNSSEYEPTLIEQINGLEV